MIVSAMEQFKCGEVYRDLEGKMTYICQTCPEEFLSAIEFEEHVIIHYIEEDPEEILDEPTTSLIKIEAVSDSEYIVEGRDDDEVLETVDAETFDEIEILEYDNEYDKVIRCNCCSQYFACLGVMEKHHRTDEDPANICGQCPAYFDDPVDLVTHRKIHKLTSIFKCIHCLEVFENEEELMAHTVPQPLSTQKPEQEQKRQRQQVAREEAEQPGSEEDISPQIGDGKGRSRYSCNICQKEYTYLHYLKQHLKKHKDNTLLHTCDVCGHEFKLRQNLLAHMRIHTGEKPYQCKLCHKSFNQPYYMTVHMRIHQKEKPYQCSLCGVSFVTSSHLGRHMKSHNNIKPHKCTLCDKAFILPGHLHDHIRSQHTGERPFSCVVGIDLSIVITFYFIFTF